MTSPNDSNAHEPPPKTPFSQELRELIEHFGDRPVSVEEFIHVTRGRGYNLLLICTSLPFLTPIPLPGFSIPFGVAFALIGARIALNQAPWLPQRLLRKELPPRSFSRAVSAASRIVRFLELFLRPRFLRFSSHTLVRRSCGAMIAVCGVLMLLPLPLPFSNSLPAWCVLLLAAGLMERDGAFQVLGTLVFALAAGYFTMLALGGAHLVENLHLFWPLMTIGR